MTGPDQFRDRHGQGGGIERFLTQLPQKYEVAKGDLEVQGVMITIDAQHKQCVNIKRIREKIA